MGTADSLRRVQYSASGRISGVDWVGMVELTATVAGNAVDSGVVAHLEHATSASFAGSWKQSHLV